MLAIASIAIFGVSSCKKERVEVEPITQTIEVTLKMNESYTFTLPKNTYDDAFGIATQAAHYAVSALGNDVAGNEVYRYQPAKDYKGTDTVVLSNPEEAHGNGAPHPTNGQHNGGVCAGNGGTHAHGAHDEAETNYVITIHFKIVGDNTTKTVYSPQF